MRFRPNCFNLKPLGSTANVPTMFRLFRLMIVVTMAFGGGFYAGFTYYESELRQDPNKFVQLYKNEFSTTAKERIDALKQLLQKKND